MAADTRPFVLAAVGTDHHPFDRFIEWLDGWQRDNPDYEVFIQRGTTQMVPETNSAPFLEPGELEHMMQRATAIVCHGGPSTIMEARAAGIVPIVVPRDPKRGEHVDEHQLRFAQFMTAKGAILQARTEVELAECLTSVVHGDVELVAPGSPTETLERISAVVDELMVRPTRQRFPRLGLIS